MSIKATFNSKEMSEAVGFVANVVNQYALDNSNIYVQVNVGKKGSIVYSNKGVYVSVNVSFRDFKEGSFVVEPYFLEELPKRSADTSIEVTKDDEGSFKLSYANGKSKGELVIANDDNTISKLDEDNLPTKFVTLSKAQLATTVNKMLFNSVDQDLDKKVGLPIKIVAKGKKANIYSGDKWCALAYTLELKEKAEGCDILTQGSLLKTAFSLADDEIKFASNEKVTRIMCKKFDLIVPTQELQIFDPDTFFERQGKVVSSVTFDMKKVLEAIDDVLIISKISNLDSKADISVKQDKLIISNKANVGKAKTSVKCKSKSDFNFSIYTDWLINFGKNFDGEVKLNLYKAAGVLYNSDESVMGIIPIMDGQ